MKKLMVAVAIVCAAAMAQAAQFNWKAGAISDFAGTGLYSGAATLHVFNATGGEQTYEGTFGSDGKIALLVGDDSSGSAGFIKQYETYSAYYTMTDAAGNVFTSGTKSNLTANYPQAASISFLKTGSWTAAPVPEPTSGLLLLLGVAGMALRRRRA